MKTSLIKVGDAVANPYAGEAFEAYYTGRVKDVSSGSFAALLGHTAPEQYWERDKDLGFNDPISRCADLDGGLGKFIYNLFGAAKKMMWAMGKKESANSVDFVLNLPWRGVARMSGVFSDEQVYAMLDVVNRKKGSWKPFLRSLISK